MLRGDLVAKQADNEYLRRQLLPETQRAEGISPLAYLSDTAREQLWTMLDRVHSQIDKKPEPEQKLQIIES